MRKRGERRFTVADGMILAAAAGVATMVVRDYLRGLEYLGMLNGGRYLPEPWMRWVKGSIPVAGAFSSALLICRLLRPRPRRLRLWLLPGTAPGLVVALGSLQVFAESAYKAVRAWNQAPARAMGMMPYPYFLNYFEIVCEAVADFVGFAVRSTWLLLFLGGRWRAEASWVDRVGRALGIYWIGLFFLLRWRQTIQGA